MRNKINNFSGVSLIELLVGIVVSVLIMAAMYTSYTTVNNTYSQVTDKAKNSQSGRNILSMIIRDIRLAGFKHFEDTLITRELGAVNSNEPIKITPDRGNSTANVTSECDHIEIVYGDVAYNPTANPTHTYERYKVRYFCEASDIIDKTAADGVTTIDTNALYKSKLKWDNLNDEWDSVGTGTYQAQLITDYVEDLNFIVKDKDGTIIDPPPTNDNVNRLQVFDIRSVEIALTVRSVKQFYKTNTKADGKNRSVIDIEDRALPVESTDRFLRDTITVSVNTRNLGL